MHKANIPFSESLAAMEELLGYRFSNPSLLGRALTHTSYANEKGLGQDHNERQEFLGDAVMELCISHELFHRFPGAREGDLTRLRSSLVNTQSFADLARRTGMDRYLLLGRGEEGQGGRARDSVLSDLFEAVMAAVYLDGGFDAVRGAVVRIFADRWPASAGDARKPQNSKTRLQEVVQRRFGGERPVYTPVSQTGPSHACHFVVRLTLPDGRTFTGEGSSSKKAEHCAAEAALAELGASAPAADR